jgi:aldehyde dehydrogenase (NAD+)
LQRRLVHAYKQVRIGDPLDPTTLVGPLIDQNAVRAFERAIGAAQAAGGELLVGGSVLDRPGNYVEPAIILARNDWEIVQKRDLWTDPVSDRGGFARAGDRAAE